MVLLPWDFLSGKGVGFFGLTRTLPQELMGVCPVRGKWGCLQCRVVSSSVVGFYLLWPS